MFHYFRVSNKFRNARRGLNHGFVSKLVSLTVPKIFARGALLCFTKILISKHFMDERVGGGGGCSITIFNTNFLFHGTELFRRGTLQGVTDFGCAKVLCLRVMSQFLVDFFVSHYRKILQGLCCAVSESFR